MTKIRHILLLMLAAMAVAPAMAEAPAAFLHRCVAKLNAAKTISADFTAASGGHTQKGTLITKGKRFAITSTTASTWFDGTDMWVYSAASREASVWKPTAAELAESNPLLYLSTASDYNVADAGTVKGGIRYLTLTPKRRGGVRSIKVGINTGTLLPVSLDIVSGGGTATVKISNVRLNRTVADSEFRFPRAKYPRARINDLR